MDVLISVNSTIVSQNFFMCIVFIPRTPDYNTAHFALREEEFLEQVCTCTPFTRAALEFMFFYFMRNQLQ